MLGDITADLTALVAAPGTCLVTDGSFALTTDDDDDDGDGDGDDVGVIKLALGPNDSLHTLTLVAVQGPSGESADAAVIESRSR